MKTIGGGREREGALAYKGSIVRVEGGVRDGISRKKVGSVIAFDLEKNGKSTDRQNICLATFLVHAHPHPHPHL